LCGAARPEIPAMALLTGTLGKRAVMGIVAAIARGSGE
jgi:hypothetical protein